MINLDRVAPPGKLSRLLVAALALGAGLSCAQPTRPRERKVNVAVGRSLNFQIAGTGSPTVVFEGGLGMPLEGWSTVQPRVAQFTRTVAYDRAGLGKSGPGPKPRTARQMAFEMREMLRRGEVQPPYVLVGYGFGAYIVRLCASLFPSEVVGLVLINPAHENYEDGLKRMLTPEEYEAHLKRKAEADASLPEGARPEAEAQETSLAQIRAGGFFPDVPMVVLTADKLDAASLGWVPEEKVDKIRDMRLGIQRSLAQIVADGRTREAKDSGANVMGDDPDSVVQAVAEIVKTARVRQ